MCDEMMAVIPEGSSTLFGTFTRNENNNYTLISTFFN